jgi:hypothetical protein
MINRSRPRLMIRAESSDALDSQRWELHRSQTEIGVPMRKRHDHTVMLGRVRRLVVVTAVTSVCGLLRLMHQGVGLRSHRQHIQH